MTRSALGRSLAITTLGAFAVTAFAAGAPRKITSVEGITEYALDNGMKVLLVPDDSKSTVTVNATYFVGSRHEGYGETGMAHLLEHMLFKGTPTNPKVWEGLQKHGANFNGTTSYDRTNYFETLSATDENIEFGLQLEADRMVNSFVRKEDLVTEFTVVRNEFEMGENNPLGVLSERIWSTAYLWHNYGKSTIGSREDIERVPIDRLKAFYQKYYQPDNSMLVVAGKFDQTKVLNRINELFGAIPKPTRTLEKTYTVEPTQDGEREVILRRVGDVQAFGCLYHICAAAHEDAMPLAVLADILDADKTGWLYKALIEPKLATRVSVSSETLYDPGAFDISVELRTDQDLAKVRQITTELMDKLGTAKFTDEEIGRAKSNFARGFDMMLRDSGRVALRLTESAASGDWRLMFLNRDRMAKVTAADVQRVAANYFKPSNRTVGVFQPTKNPDRASIPPTPDFNEILKDYKGAAELAKGKAFEATYPNIEANTQRSNLPNGMQVALLPKETRGNRVNVNMSFHYGSEAELKGKIDAASFLAPMLMRGTKSMTRRQIEDKLAELKATVNLGAGGGGMGGGRLGRMAGRAGLGVLDCSVECTRENLPKVLDLVSQILKEPAFPADEFDTLKQEMIAGLEQQLSEPMVLAFNAIQRKLNPYDKDDVRYVSTPTEQIEAFKAVKLADVQGLYSGYLGASSAEAAAIGDFDAKELTAALTKHFGDWKSAKPFARVASQYKVVEPSNDVIKTPDKANALFAAGMTIEIRDDDADYPAIFMANYILGGNPSSRLMNRIRQKEGLSYGCGSAMQASSLDKTGVFMSYGICAPENADKALACAKEELALLIKSGVTDEELAQAKKGYKQSVDVQLSNDGAVTGMLARNLFVKRTMKFNEDQMKKIDSLTSKDVQAAAAKYLSAEKLVIIRAGDFDKQGVSVKPQG